MAEESDQVTNISPGQEIPTALLEWMSRDWGELGGGAPMPALPSARRCNARRQALSELFPGTALVIPAGGNRTRANDTMYRFRPGSDFVYLVGDGEPGEVLVLLPRAGSGHDAVLFTEPDTEYERSEFFTDHHKGALWVGSPRGIRATEARFAIEARPLPQLRQALTAQEQKGLLRGLDADLDALVSPAPALDQPLGAAISELRLYKDDSEVQALTEACRVTQLGFVDIVRALPTVTTEREIDAVFQFRAHREAAGVGYTPIAAAGPNATTLHWIRRSGSLKNEDLLLVDAGAEVAGYYTADVTRTLPISGHFSPAQRRIYDIVWQAHQAALKSVRPGTDFVAPHRAAMAAISEGLSELGILQVPAEDALRDDRQLYKRYTIHNVSHMLGIDVHDCTRARPEVSIRGPLAKDMVITVEPGVYFQLNDETVPKEYRGIGIRIEDDILVTENGYRNLSADLPVEADNIEAWMAKIWSDAKDQPKSDSA